MNIFKKLSNNKVTIMYFLIVINAPMDFLVSISRRFSSSPLSIATLVRGTTFILIFIYISNISYKNLKKGVYDRTVWLSSLSIIGSLAFILTRPSSFQFKNYIVEINSLIRYLYFPYVFMFFSTDFSMNKKEFDYTLKILKLTGFLYSSLIVFPTIFGVGFKSYSMDGLSGNVGWLFGANEIGLIIGVLLTTFLVDYYRNQLKRLDYIYIITSFLAILILGTKGSLVLMLLFILLVLIDVISMVRSEYKIRVSISFLFLISIFIFFTPVGENVRFLLDNSGFGRIISVLLSGRITFLKIAIEQYSNSSIFMKIFGIGVQSLNSNGVYVISKLIEMDLFEVYIRYGLMITILVFYPFVHIFKKSISFIKKSRNSVKEVTGITSMIFFTAVLGILIGHVVSAPSVSIYIVIYVVLLNYIINYHTRIYNDKNLKEDKSMLEISKKIIKGDNHKILKELELGIVNNQKCLLVTANSEIFVHAETAEDLQEILRSRYCKIAIDGIAAYQAMKYLGVKETAKIPGVDIVEEMLDVCDKSRLRLAVLGGTPQSNDNFSNMVNKKYPNIVVTDMLHGYIDNKESAMLEISKNEPDLILIGLGVPNQEILIANTHDFFNKGLFIGCGGSLDVLGNSKKRAPKFFIVTSTEWLYRIVLEPNRIGRFVKNNIKFLKLVIQAKNENGY